MLECTLDYSLIYKKITIICNNESLFNKICLYFSELIIPVENTDTYIKIEQLDSSSIINTSFCNTFETELGNEIDSINYILELEIFNKELLNKNIFALHGSSVFNKIKNKSNIIIGNTHAGKSTFIIYLLNKGYKFIVDDMILINKVTKQINYFPQPIHIRENSTKFLNENLYNNLLYYTNDTYFIPNNKMALYNKNSEIDFIILIEYNKIENSITEIKGFNKLITIIKNIKGTNIDNWHELNQLLDDVKLYHIKYNDFKFIDDNIDKL